MLTPLTDTYDKIHRSDCGNPLLINKSAIVGHIRDMAKDKQLALISKLVAIKYYGQSGFWNNVKDIDEQNRHWNHINHDKNELLPPKTTIEQLMGFIKNESYFVQRKVPDELKILLLSYNDEDRKKIVSSFDLRLRPMIRDFLSDALDEHWCDLPDVSTEPIAIRTGVSIIDEIRNKSASLKNTNWISALNVKINTGVVGLIMQFKIPVDLAITAINELNYDKYYETKTYIMKQNMGDVLLNDFKDQLRKLNFFVDDPF